ncbi:MAG TPA: PEGA domain-containing protein [Myxococcales bacterium]
MATQYIALGPMLSGEGSRAFIGLRIADGEASPCALIWVPEATLTEPEKIEQLRRDTSRAAGLVHPNIVRVYGLVEIEPSLARVVEFADAESLRKVLDVTKRLPTGFAALVANDAALGVQYAHMAGNEDGSPLLHGDLRPETLLTSYNGRTKVSGYGALNVAPKEMGGKRVMGRRLHCAPEQIVGGREAVTVATDVYLLGLILYECLTGSIPFAEEKNFDKAVLGKQLPLLNSEFVPPSLRPVIGRAMAKKGPQRYQTVQEFRAAIEEAVDLPDHADFAEFLAREFKVDDARLARQRVIDNGMEEWVLKKGFRIAPAAPLPPRRKPKPEPAPAPAAPAPAAAATSSAPVATSPAPAASAPAAALSATPAPAPAAPAAPSAPAPAPGTPAPGTPALAPAVRPSAPKPAEDRAERAKPAAAGRSPWIAVVPVMAIGLGVAFFLGKSTQQPGQPVPPVAAPVALDAAEAAAPVAVHPPEVAVPAAAGPDANPPAPVAAKPVEPKPAQPKPAAETPAPTPTPKPAAPAKAAILDISVEPAVNVSIDGKPAGKTPLQAEVKPGNHKLAFTDPAQGISIVRNVRAKPGTNPISFTIGRGSVGVSCPPGAEVRIDGRVVGTTPLKGPVPVVEGSHRIVVSKGGAKWQQVFEVGDGERMDFEVEISGD